MKWETLKSMLCKQKQSMESVEIHTTDVFRITKMAYKDGYLLIFLTGYTHDNDKKAFQFVVETKCDLYSYRTCYNDHVFNNCRNDCKSYKTFVMPGLKGAHMEKINVVKYKRDNKYFVQAKPLDHFLRDINRIHMQTDLKEGQYVTFNDKQQCDNNRLKCIANDLDTLKTMFRIVPAEELKREIVPVISSFDIETHSNGQKFSNANENPIMSISLVTRRDEKNMKICLYFMQGADDLDANINDEKNVNDTIAIRYEDELQMLQSFFELLPLLNPDYLIDYNGDKFDIPYIVDRIKLLCVARKNFVNTAGASKRPKYSNDNVTAEKIMKIRRYDLEPISIETQILHDKFSNKLNNHLLTYYVHVDLYQFLSNDSEHKNLENFQLNTVAEHYLKTNKVDLSILEMLKLYNANFIKKIIEYNVQDSILTIDLFQKLEIIDFLYTQCMLLYLSTDDLLCNISHKINVVFFNLCITNKSLVNGETVSDPFMFNKNDLAITSGRKNRFVNFDDNENVPKDILDLNLLKRKAVKQSDIPADAIKLCSVKGSSALEGGFVIEPISGLKKWVVTLDFNSLYLTIMMYEGACLSNLFVAEDNNVYLNKNKDAINPKVLQELADLRTKYKSRRDQYEPGNFFYNLYDKLQNAVKRIANSIYGYFGIYFRPLANHITKIGRSKLIESVNKIEAMSGDPIIKQKFNLSKINFKVIYGDTDSCFIQIEFDENEIESKMRFKTIEKIVKDNVLKNLNESWHGTGYKMALENIMSNLILLKKKKYCYINGENRIKYKGWLIKKDMPIFMRKIFRQVVDLFLKNHSVACGLKLLHALLSDAYNNFGKNNNYVDYSFSMSYNENSTSKNKKESNSNTKPPVLTIAKHCREILMQSGTKSLPGNGDRIPFLLIDIKGKVTEKSYPVSLFGPINRVSWLKHMGILCNFMNELIEIFGADETTSLAFEHYFSTICAIYMQKQVYDVKYPVLTTSKKVTLKKDENKQIVKVANNVKQFKLYVKPLKIAKKMYVENVCDECKQKC